MSRCECGRELALASIQPHQKNSAVLVAVCSGSLLPPQDCTEQTIVKLRKGMTNPPGYGVFVHDVLIGTLVCLDETWTWSINPDGQTWDSSTRDEAVRSILRNTTR